MVPTLSDVTIVLASKIREVLEDPRRDEVIRLWISLGEFPIINNILYWIPVFAHDSMSHRRECVEEVSDLLTLSPIQKHINWKRVGYSFYESIETYNFSREVILSLYEDSQVRDEILRSTSYRTPRVRMLIGTPSPETVCHSMFCFLQELQNLMVILSVQETRCSDRLREEMLHAEALLN